MQIITNFFVCSGKKGVYFFQYIVQRVKKLAVANTKNNKRNAQLNNLPT